MVISGTVAAVAAVTALFGGVLGASKNAHDEGYDEGYKDGFNDASSIYEAKFIALRDEAEKSQGIISEQKRLLREAEDLITELQSYIDTCQAGGVIIDPDLLLTYANAKEFTGRLRLRAA